MTTLGQRIDNILGPWPTPDGTLEAFRLLAKHLQRHDELVTLQRDIDAYAECRRMPDDALDALEAHRDRLRQEIWDGTPIPHLAKEAEAELDAANERIEELQEGASKADVGPLDLEAIESKAHRLMVATWECDKLSYTDQWQLTSRDVPALVAEVRRLHAERDKAQAEVAEHRRHVATVMQREEALKKRVEELEHEKYVGQVKGWADEYERDADAEVGRAIRGLRPRKGHISVTLTVTVIDDAVSLARVTWEELYRAAGGATACYHGRGCVIPAIAEYIKEEG